MAKLVIGTNKTVGTPAIVKEVIPVEKYALLSRVKDDSNNEIGTVVGYHTDANNIKYAVVCLDAQYRLALGQYLSNSASVTGLTNADDLKQASWDFTDTATYNCTKILDFATANGYTSSAVSHCRSKSFIIEGVTYYGQLPTLSELTVVFMNRTAINSKDTSASQYSSLIVPNSTPTWSSTQGSSGYARMMNVWGLPAGETRTQKHFVIPILEIPID